MDRHLWIREPAPSEFHQVFWSQEYRGNQRSLWPLQERNNVIEGELITSWVLSRFSLVAGMMCRSRTDSTNNDSQEAKGRWFSSSSISVYWVVPPVFGGIIFFQWILPGVHREDSLKEDPFSPYRTVLMIQECAYDLLDSPFNQVDNQS